MYILYPQINKMEGLSLDPLKEQYVNILTPYLYHYVTAWCHQYGFITDC